MADRIVMEVTRYRPEIESEPVLQAYEVPVTRTLEDADIKKTSVWRFRMSEPLRP